MLKALEILKFLKNGKNLELLNKEKIDEAIIELEDLSKNHNSKVKNCEGCKFGKFGIDSLGVEVECSLVWDCSRGRKDNWEPK